MPDCLLETRDLAFYTPEGLPLFRAEGFRLLAGDFLHIHGENGSGKSTAVKAFLGRYTHFTGEISRFFQPEKVAFLPQMGNTSHLLPLSLGDVVGLACDVTAASIAKVGLLRPDDLRRPWNTSSGGERQKALLTQAFGSGADLIILDEPFNHLDTAARTAVTGLIAAARRAGTAIIAVSHDTPELAAKASLSLCTDGGGSITGTQRRGRKTAASKPAGQLAVQELKRRWWSRGKDDGAAKDAKDSGRVTAGDGNSALKKRWWSRGKDDAAASRSKKPGRSQSASSRNASAASKAVASDDNSAPKKRWWSRDKDDAAPSGKTKRKTRAKKSPNRQQADTTASRSANTTRTKATATTKATKTTKSKAPTRAKKATRNTKASKDSG